MGKNLKPFNNADFRNNLSVSNLNNCQFFYSIIKNMYKINSNLCKVENLLDISNKTRNIVNLYSLLNTFFNSKS